MSEKAAVHGTYVYLGKSAIPGAGRGVFAGKEFKEDELIEECPMIVMGKASIKHLDKTELENYYFEWTDEYDRPAIALGYGSLYNHSYNPNAYFDQDFKHHIVRIYAFRDIAADEEITFNYNGDPEDQTEISESYFRQS